jgi:hypothetical protein
MNRPSQKVFVRIHFQGGFSANGAALTTAVTKKAKKDS